MTPKDPKLRMKGAINLGLVIDDRIARQATEFERSLVGVAQSPATQGSGGDPGGNTETGDGITQVTKTLSVADNSSGYIDLGTASGIAACFIKYWIRRNSATAIREVGKFEVLHDGSTAIIAGRQGGPMPGPGNAGVSFSASIVTGTLRVTATTSNLTPDATADIILTIDTMEALL